MNSLGVGGAICASRLTKSVAELEARSLIGNSI